MNYLIKDLNKILDITIILLILMIFSIYNNTLSLYTFSCANDLVITNGSKENNIIALSFDDGPHPKYTNQILDLLKEYNIKATFFILGKNAELYPEIIRREESEGHEVGNHSYSHIDMRKASNKTIKEEYEKTQEIIYSISNTKPKVFRPPYGTYNNEIIKIVSSDDSAVILWTYYQDSKDWSNPGVNKIVATTLSKVQNGDIILFHDYVYKPESQTLEALKIILPKLIDKGYKFVTISELINISQEKKTINNYNQKIYN